MSSCIQPLSCQSFKVNRIKLPAVPKPGNGPDCEMLAGTPSIKLTSEFGEALPAGNTPPLVVGIATGILVPGWNLYIPFTKPDPGKASLLLTIRYSTPAF